MPRPKDVPITLDKTGDETHPSWGTIRVHRCSGSVVLFDSVARHQHFIALSIHRASRKRDLNQDWIHGGMRELIEINMTESQFARMLSSAGDGSGVPCTLSRIQGELIPGAPDDKIGDTYKQEIKDASYETTERLRAIEEKLEEMLAGKTVKKGDLRDLQGTVRSACMAIDDHLPFLIGQVEEKLENVVDEAKTNIESFLQLRAQQLGMSQMLGANDVAPVPVLRSSNDDED